MVGTGGGGIWELGKGPEYFLRAEGGIVLVSHEAEEQRRWGFGREKMVKGRLCHIGWVKCPWEIREPLGRAAKHCNDPMIGS